ncbi:MAG: basic amino acid ABC transporter substrate-binding protein [Burkholderiaceae bacterium]|nr:basic amino acid ABC transporter substrate-binding protein [Burkholderiaceae bacterium]
MFLKKLLMTSAAVLAFASLGTQAAETYVVGTGATYRPFEYETPQKELVGFDIDLMRAIAKAEGFEVKFINTPWEGIFATVDKGDRDIIMSGITITEKRKQAVDFSNPYFLAHQLILTTPDVKIQKLADIQKGGVAVVSGSAGDIAASEAFGKASTRIRRFDNTPLALEELNQGGVVAAIGDVGVLAFYSRNNPDKKFNMVRDPNFKEQYFGIAVRKGNQALLNKINSGLAKVIANGEYEKVYQKWFGTSAPKLPQ